MTTERKSLVYDVLIAGAGPAGCACALALKNAGLKVALVEKNSFPRDKVCGDAIPGRAIRTLNNIDPAYYAAFSSHTAKCITKHTTLFYNNKTISIDWVLDAYTCTRMEFDNFLFSLVQEHTATDIYTTTQPERVSIQDGTVTISLKNDEGVMQTRMVIGADGAHSVVAKQLTGNGLDRKHHVAAVRAYFAGVAGMEDDTTEIYFDKKFLPSYLWIFPIHGGMANVGFGMLSHDIAKRKVNLKDVFYQFIDNMPALKNRFSGAVLHGALEGFGLPLGSRAVTVAGDNFMLAGDAASLIDPITGDGIGNAMISGKLAAEQIIRCFAAQNFNGAFMNSYRDALHSALGKELRARYKAQRLFASMPLLLDAAFLAGQSKMVKNALLKAL